MVAVTEHDVSGSTLGGVYDVPEAARYLRASSDGAIVYPVSSRKMINWIRRGVATPALATVPGRELLFEFEDLISMRVIAALRASGVGWPAIHQAEQWLRRETQSERPFATDSLWTGQRQIFIQWRRQLVSASTSGQAAFDFLFEQLIHVHGLVFNEKTQVAKSWEPAPSVVLEPQVQFGAPCIKGTRIPTRSVAGMIEAGDSTEYVASAYDLAIKDVEDACEWERLLRAA